MRILTITAFIQYCAGGPNQKCKTRKINKNKLRLGRNNTIINYSLMMIYLKKQKNTISSSA